MLTRRMAAAVTFVAVALSGCIDTPAAPTSTPSITDIAIRNGTRLSSSQLQQMCHPNPTRPRLPATGGPVKTIVASTFYIGEEAGPSNAEIDNISTAWNGKAATDFGGADRWGPLDPEQWQGRWYDREGLCPAGLSPRQNIFYVALPTPDFDEQGRLPGAFSAAKMGATYLPDLAKRIKNGQEWLFKNLWVEVRYDGKVAYGQLEDIGPSADTGTIVADYDYVWGDSSTPKNDFGLHAGIDISPAMTDYLGTKGQATVSWRWVPQANVPDGPWKVLVTASEPRW